MKIKNKRSMGRGLRIWYITVCIIAVLVIAFNVLLNTGIIDKNKFRSWLAGNDKNPSASESMHDDTESGDINKAPDSAIILAAGDILVHSPQLDAQYDSATGKYDFMNNFKYVKEYIEAADYAVVNFETTMAGNTWRAYSGYPSFNTPDALAEALKKSGFDMILTSNNHIYDSGEQGYFRTLEVLKQNSFDVIGARTELSQKRYLVRDINNIKIGFANFCYETTINGGPKTLNGITLSSRVAELVDTFMPEQPEPAYEVMESIIADMKMEGAEYIIFFIHWGNEYHTTPNHFQVDMAQRLSEMGVDAVIGGHPHVLQHIDVVTSSTGRKTLVAYSMGNFLSNQRFELMVDLTTSHTEDGMMLTLKLEREDSGEVALKEVVSIPTWVHKYFTAEGKPVYEIVPLEKALKDKEAYNLYASYDAAVRAEGSLTNTLAILKKRENDVREVFSFITKVPDSIQ